MRGKQVKIVMRTRNLKSGRIFFKIFACSTVSDALFAFIFRATAAYEDVMVCAHHKSELLKFGLLMAQFPA